MERNVAEALRAAGIDPDSVPDGALVEMTSASGPGVRVLVNDNVKMSSKKLAAQAVHAALAVFGIDHGRVVVLGGKPRQIESMPVVIRDAGQTELQPGTLTAGAMLEDE